MSFPRQSWQRPKRHPAHSQKRCDALEKDHKFLTEGDVFTDDLIETWIQWKREKELDEIALRPHPHEFHLYYDA